MSFAADTNPPEVGLIWHYATASGFEAILKSREIWLTEATRLNDREELQHVLTTAKAGALATAGNPVRGGRHANAYKLRRIERVEALFRSRHDVFVGSFSRSGDLLPQWRDYSLAGGVALGLERAILQQLALGTAVSFHDVIYDVKSEGYEAASRELFQLGGNVTMAPASENDTDLALIHSNAARIKHAGFRHEGEVRAIYVPNSKQGPPLPLRERKGNDGGGPVRYVAFCWRRESICALKKIYLAPSAPADRSSLIVAHQAVLERHGFSVPIWPSTIPFRF